MSKVDRPLNAFRQWAVEQAFPLWASRGFDAQAGLFEEQLGFDGTPVVTVPRRVMVQARQICVFTLATRHGWYDGRRIAVTAGRSLIDQFWAKDKIGGWFFSLNRDGTIADDRRDLYANAFVLFAMAGLIELTGDRRFVDAVERTLVVLDQHFTDKRGGGLWDAVPRQDGLRRQNPHMHLLEAYMALHDVTADEAYLARAEAIVDLAEQWFIDCQSGALCEYYDDDWRVTPCPGQGCVEPGHLFEWAWLLRRYEVKTGNSMDSLVKPLLAAAFRHGTDRLSGRIIDEVCEDGRVCRRTSRSWPHAEAIKSIGMEYHLGQGDLRTEAAAMLDRLRRVYCPDHLGGGWIDHVAEDDTPMSRVMPASTLYHLAYALSEGERCFETAPRARQETRRDNQASPVMLELQGMLASSTPYAGRVSEGHPRF